MTERINFFELAAKRKISPLPDGFEFSEWELIGPDTIVYRGGIARKISRGKRKGQLTWGKITHKVAVTKEEARKAAEQYELETGKCSECCGTGEVWAGWNCDTGNRYKTCSKCGGSGLKKEGQR